MCSKNASIEVLSKYGVIYYQSLDAYCPVDDTVQNQDDAEVEYSALTLPYAGFLLFLQFTRDSFGKPSRTGTPGDFRYTGSRLRLGSFESPKGNSGVNNGNQDKRKKIKMKCTIFEIQESSLSVKLSTS
jgi:hypothetical protein